MSEYHKFIHDENQIKQFVSILSPLKPEEAYFVSMSARNKYLTEQERRHYDLGRTEMFARKLVKQDKKKIVSMKENYLRVIKSLQVSHGGYTSRSGISLPDHCLIVYANINPVSGIKALEEFQMKMIKSLFDMRTNPEAPSNFGNLDTQLMNCYQRSRGTRTLVDIDFDIPEEGIDILENFLDEIKLRGIKYYIIKTQSGFHVLLNKEDIKFNYNDLINKAHEGAQAKFGEDRVEVVLNKNEMVPIPGTLQAGHKVRFFDL